MWKIRKGFRRIHSNDRNTAWTWTSWTEDPSLCPPLSPVFPSPLLLGLFHFVPLPPASASGTGCGEGAPGRLHSRDLHATPLVPQSCQDPQLIRCHQNTQKMSGGWALPHLGMACSGQGAESGRVWNPGLPCPPGQPAGHSATAAQAGLSYAIWWLSSATVAGLALPEVPTLWAASRSARLTRAPLLTPVWAVLPAHPQLSTEAVWLFCGRGGAPCL